ncbi:MAG: hypothetical protein ABI898_06480 [Sphingomonadales bacterium]
MTKLRCGLYSTVTATALLAAPAIADATDLTFTANLINVCILSVGQQGTLAVTTDGKTLTSETSGGAAATLSVVAVGLNPTINFTAPTLQSPNGWTGTPTTSIRYQSVAGANRAYTTAASSAPINALIDTFTVNSKVDNLTGFLGGQYVVRTTVTCQQ